MMIEKSCTNWLLVLSLLVAFSGCLCAQQKDCREIASMARMARSRSIQALANERHLAGGSYQEKVVSAAREFELRRTDKRAAAALLDLIPTSDEQASVWTTLGESVCDTELLADMFSLGALRDRLPRDLASAVLFAPDKMRIYVTFASRAVQDPHNDYAVQMQTVCRRNHRGLSEAVESLQKVDRDWFVKHILNPQGCIVLAYPEAD